MGWRMGDSRRLAALWGLFAIFPLPVVGAEPEAVFLDNGTVRLGVDKGAGASIFYFGESGTERNLINHADRGRFIQQSFYGAPDGSRWNDKPWRWNPVQGGNWKGRPALLEALEVAEHSIYTRTIPHHWASRHLIKEARMEQWISLDGPVARLRYRFRYDGDTEHPITHQELPAVFLDFAFPRLVYYAGDHSWSGDRLTQRVPGWPNEYYSVAESWAAYVDEDGWGCGLYFPGTKQITAYRHAGPAGPTGMGCSYFAPIRSLAVEPGLRLDYTVFLTLGSVSDIRRRFRELHERQSREPRHP